MAISVLDKPLFIVKEYRATYNINSKAKILLTHSDFNIEDIEGYTIAGIHKYHSGRYTHQVYALDPIDSAQTMRIYNYTSTNHTNDTAILWIVWVRNDAITIS